MPAASWYGHILKQHPEVSNLLGLVEAAVTSPIEIRFSKYDPLCRIYLGRGPRPGLMMVVVADVESGIVKTAHITRRASGGAIEWQSSTR